MFFVTELRSNPGLVSGPVALVCRAAGCISNGVSCSGCGSGRPPGGLDLPEQRRWGVFRSNFRMFRMFRNGPVTTLIRRFRNNGRGKRRGGPPRVRWDPSEATRREITMILRAVFGTVFVKRAVFTVRFWPMFRNTRRPMFRNTGSPNYSRNSVPEQENARST